MRIITAFLLMFTMSLVLAQDNTMPLLDNEELQEIYKADQSDRRSKPIDCSIVNPRDSAREVRVYKLLDSGKVRTALDYKNAAMIFQHGNDTIASSMAIKMMRKAVELDSDINKWLLAAAIDRHLMNKNEPQIFGTQYTRKGVNMPWVLYELDSTAITDAERKEYRVPTLAQQKMRLLMMNKKKLIELIEDSIPIKDILDTIETANIKTSKYNTTQGGINSFGYQLMRMERTEDALKVFKLNTEIHSNGYNTFDSYGECLLKLGRIEESKKAYEKSLELNPNNLNAINVLRGPQFQ